MWIRHVFGQASNLIFSSRGQELHCQDKVQGRFFMNIVIYMAEIVMVIVRCDLKTAHAPLKDGDAGSPCKGD